MNIYSNVRQQNFDEFMRGFAHGTGLDQAHATEQWAGFSRQLNEENLVSIEARGFEAGLVMALEWQKAFGDEVEDDDQ